MGYRTQCFGLTCILFAYCTYTPVPENTEKPRQVGVVHVYIKTSCMGVFFPQGTGMPCYKYKQTFFQLAF